MPGLIISVIRTLLFQEKLSVFPLENRGTLILAPFFFSILCNLGSCKAEQVFHISWEETVRKLNAGDLAFILEAEPQELQKFGRLHPSAAFYTGLLVRASESDQREISRNFMLFEAALGSPSTRIREEAAQELLLPVLGRRILARRIDAHIKNKLSPQKRLDKDGDEIGVPPLITLQGAALYTLGRSTETLNLLGKQKVPSSWDRAITLLTTIGLHHENPPQEPDIPKENPLRGESLDFFLRGVPDRAYTWAFKEIQERFPDFLTEAELAAIAGRSAVSHSSYQEGLQAFRLVLKQDHSLFFQYPELTGDLGRSFQYTGSQREGIPLFLEWDGLLQTEHIDTGAIKDSIPQIRYRLLYFMGRMERQRGNYTKALEYFKTALSLAPDPIQEDACLWYILHTAWQNKHQDLLPLVHTYLTRWHDPSYFSDILDLLCAYLTANRQWDSMLEIFSRIRFHSDGASTAKYAYILGRAVSEGYIPVRQGLTLLGAVDMGIGTEEVLRTTLARTFFRIALEERKASFYYRGLSASYLGESMLPIPVESRVSQNKESSPHFRDPSPSEEMTLLLGFFEFGAASYAMPYIKNVRDTLSTPELRVLAESLGHHKQWLESIRLVTAYMDREDYEISPGDMNLYYPRPFMDIIEETAREIGIPVEILYGLIRTESAFDHRVVSHAGAVGLSQLMPKTAEEEAQYIKKRGGPDYIDMDNHTIDLRDPATNVYIGASYLKRLITLMKSPMQAILAYNGGASRVRRWRTAEPDLPEDLFLETIELTETREYGKRVLAAAAAYGFLYFDLSMEVIVADIFK